MKQIDECLTRAFAGKSPLPSKKWKAIIEDDLLLVFHYHHLILAYDVNTHERYREWHERPADKRGFDAALQWLEDRRKQIEASMGE